MDQIIVSLVGLTITSSSSLELGSGVNEPSSSVVNLECVTIAHSLANPSTCSASLLRKDLGIKSGKYALV